MANYEETNIDLLLEQELGRFKELVFKLQKTNESFIETALQIEEIKQKYENISFTITEIESKLREQIDTADFVSINSFQTHKDEINTFLLNSKNAELNIKMQLDEFDKLLQGLEPKLDVTLKEKTRQLVPYSTFEKGISDLQQIIEKYRSESIDIVEFKRINNSLENLNNDVADINRIVGDFDKEERTKFEAKTSSNIKKINDQINQFSLKIESIKLELIDLVSKTKLQELEKKITDKTIALESEIVILKKQNMLFSAQIDKHKNYHAYFLVLNVVMFLLVLIALIN